MDVVWIKSDIRIPPPTTGFSNILWHVWVSLFFASATTESLPRCPAASQYCTSYKMLHHTGPRLRPRRHSLVRFYNHLVPPTNLCPSTTHQSASPIPSFSSLAAPTRRRSLSDLQLLNPVDDLTMEVELRKFALRLISRMEYDNKPVDVFYADTDED
ncbi:hypothetical protein CPB85DRAFT_297217 [Mucidula mucida]|nr:hypothetical protein CPB85DRAFT_297217 [Mucidula mucida]